MSGHIDMSSTIPTAVLGNNGALAIARMRIVRNGVFRMSKKRQPRSIQNERIIRMRAAEGERDSVAPTQLEAHHLAEVLDFRPDQGIIRLHEQRVVLLSAAAMGLLRKELIDTLDLETARRLFLRFGYVDGYHDAVSLRDRGKWSDRFEGLRAGSVLHRLAGIARPEIVQLEHEAKSGRFHGEVVWHDSYVAKQHVHHYGKSDTPVCWSLVGYASGYASACLGQEICFREHECRAQGVSHPRECPVADGAQGCGLSRKEHYLIWIE